VNALICDLNYDVPYPKASAKGFKGENLIKSAKLNVSIVKSLFISLKEIKYWRLISKHNSERKIYKWLKKIANETKAIAKANFDTFKWGQEDEPMQRRRQRVTELWKRISLFDVLSFRLLNSQLTILLTTLLTNLSKIKAELSKSGSKHSIIEGNLDVNYDVQLNESKPICVNHYSDSGLNPATHGDHGDLGENNECSITENVNLNVFLNVNENKDIYNLKNVTYYTSNLMFISTSIMLALTIGLLLLAQTIEPNPGPNHNDDKMDDTKDTTLKKTISQIIAYNCHGLGNPNKLRRLLLKMNNIVKKKGIFFLQETHIVNTDQLKTMWKNNFLSNCIKTNSAGVIILFNNELKIIEKYEDEEGRLLIAVLQSEDSNWIVANAYYPNDHRIGIAFAEKMYLKVLEMQAKYPNHITICAGDYNLSMMTDKDLLNRKRSKSEQLLAENIKENNNVAKLVDTYRSQNQNEGFTWNRGTCYSRLDHIFISADSIKRVKKNWCLEKSDHAAVTVDFLNVEKLQKGPGIVKVNTKILDDQKVVLEVAREIEQLMSQVDESWNPHSKLEFLKVGIRTVISTKTSEVRNGI
jgi:exonuclease III